MSTETSAWISLSSALACTWSSCAAARSRTRRRRCRQSSSQRPFALSCSRRWELLPLGACPVPHRHPPLRPRMHLPQRPRLRLRLRLHPCRCRWRTRSLEWAPACRTPRCRAVRSRRRSRRRRPRGNQHLAPPQPRLCAPASPRRPHRRPRPSLLPRLVCPLPPPTPATPRRPPRLR